MTRVLFILALLAGAGSVHADGTVNFWNRMTFKAAQAYPLDSTVYTGWGPDWAGAGIFEQMSLGFSKGPVGFTLDTQFNGAEKLDAHVNFVQGWFNLVPDTLKVYAGKIRLDDYRWNTEYTDRGMGRFQVHDNWAAAAATYTLKGTSLKASLLVPASVGTNPVSHIDASTTLPNKPDNQTLSESWSLFDAALSYEDKGTGLRFVAATIGDTSAGGAYGSTGSNLGTGFGEKDPRKSSRSWYGGIGWTGDGTNAWTAATWWADPETAVTDHQHLEVLSQAQWVKGDWKVAFDGFLDWHQGVKEETVSTSQVVSGLTSGAYNVTKGPLSGSAFVGFTYKLKLAGLDLLPGFALGGGNQDLGTSMGTYTFYAFDKFVEARASLLWNPTGLNVGFDYKYDLDAGISTWVVPVTFTFSSF